MRNVPQDIKRRVTAAYRAGYNNKPNPEPDNKMCCAAWNLGLFDGNTHRELEVHRNTRSGEIQDVKAQRPRRSTIKKERPIHNITKKRPEMAQIEHIP